MKIAIIGSGISGLTAAYNLRRDHEITVFEAGSYVGGHTNTIDVEWQRHAIDTGFIVFNEHNYPHFTALLRELGVAWQPTSMSFSVRCDRTGIEYNGTSLNALFVRGNRPGRSSNWKKGDSMPTESATLNRTKNDLSEHVRGSMVDLLQARLADAIDLQLQAKQAHWNVKGPNFIALHELFDRVAGEATAWVDDTAERLVSLGGTADGRATTIAARSTLGAYPLEIRSGEDHVAALSGALAAYGRAVRAAIDTADGVGDADTADLFTEISRGADQYLWFVEAHNHQ